MTLQANIKEEYVNNTLDGSMMGQQNVFLS